MSARNKKKAASRQSQSSSQEAHPELSVSPRRGRVTITLVLCLFVFAIISEAASAIFLGSGGLSSGVVFAIFYLVSLVYLVGLAWSAVRLLTDSRPALQADEHGLTLRHLPFLGTLSLPWVEIKSAHVVRSLFFTHLCFVPADSQSLIQGRNLLRFALNASAHFSLRTNAPLSISQSALSLPAQEVLTRLKEDFGVKETA